MIKIFSENSNQLSTLVFNLLQNKNIPSSFVEEFGQMFPEIEDDVYAFASNPNCNCRNKINLYIGFFNEKIATFIDQYATNNNLTNIITEIFNEILSDPDNPDTEVDISGRVGKTTIEQWGQFVSDLNKKNYIFKSFSVIKEGDDLLVFFL
jgi:hypothetical protein